MRMAHSTEMNTLVINNHRSKRDHRFHTILSLLDEHGHVEVDMLASHLDVSPETIRRDLSVLSEQALLRKVHGGAVKFQTAQETSFTMRTQANLAEKMAIADCAAQFVKAGDSLFINGGTTTAAFARRITQSIDNLVIITNSPFVANEFWNRGESRHQIHLLGGDYDGQEMDTVGPAVIEQIQRFRTDHAFITVGTVSATQGFMDYRMRAAEVIRAMAQQARRATVLADSSKLGQSALVIACGLADVDRLVTDSPPPDDLAEALDKANTRLYVASAPD